MPRRHQSLICRHIRVPTRHHECTPQQRTFNQSRADRSSARTPARDATQRRAGRSLTPPFSLTSPDGNGLEFQPERIAARYASISAERSSQLRCECLSLIFASQSQKNASRHTKPDGATALTCRPLGRRTGFGSRRASRDLLKQAKYIRPQVIARHRTIGYFFDRTTMLRRWLNRIGIEPIPHMRLRHLHFTTMPQMPRLYGSSQLYLTVRNLNCFR